MDKKKNIVQTILCEPTPIALTEKKKNVPLSRIWQVIKFTSQIQTTWVLFYLILIEKQTLQKKRSSSCRQSWKSNKKNLSWEKKMLPLNSCRKKHTLGENQSLGSSRRHKKNKAEINIKIDLGKRKRRFLVEFLDKKKKMHKQNKKLKNK